MDPVQQLWEQANFKTKFTIFTVLYAFNKNMERFIVIDNSGSIFRFMNKRGQVFMIAHFRCKIDSTQRYYMCDEPMHIVSCSRYTLEPDKYAFEVILPAIASI